LGFPAIRPRRLRRTEAWRTLVRETRLHPDDFVLEVASAAEAAEAAGMARQAGITALWLPDASGEALDHTCRAIREAHGEALVLMAPVPGGDGETRAVGLAHEGMDAIVLEGATPENIAATRERLELAEHVHTALVAAPGGCAPIFGGTSESMAEGEALRDTCVHCAEAGADVVLIQPALPALDAIRRAAEALAIPVAARMSTLERAMLTNAGAKGWLDEPNALHEAALSIRRAGARFIITPDAIGLAGTAP